MPLFEAILEANHRAVEGWFFRAACCSVPGSLDL